MNRSEHDSRTGGERPAGHAVLVRLERVSKTYVEGDRERLVLDAVDAAFTKGELTVIVGRSGSGKSTLLNIISGIDRPDDGAVVVGSESITDLSERDRTIFRRNRIGFVFQSFNLIPTLTVIENLLLPMELRGMLDTDRARHLLERVGLEDRSGSFPDRLSGGERQRVAVARALAHEPDLILADEPTGNLDLETGGRVMDVLETLVREEGKTMIIATHDRELLARANRILHLIGGKLGQGEPRQDRRSGGQMTVQRPRPDDQRAAP